MKTFEEAVDAVAFAYFNEHELELAREKVIDVYQRFTPLSEEAHASAKFQTVIATLITRLRFDGDYLPMFNAFMLGLMVGVEMEKADDLPQSHKVADVPATLHDILPANWETMSVAQQRDFMTAKADDFRVERDFLERGMRKLHQMSLEAAKA